MSVFYAYGLLLVKRLLRKMSPIGSGWGPNTVDETSDRTTNGQVVLFRRYDGLYDSDVLE